jgi:hypothetical protein
VEFESAAGEGDEELKLGGKIILLGRERVCFLPGDGERNWENGTSVLPGEFKVLAKCFDGEGDLAITVGLFIILQIKIDIQIKI